MTPAAAQIHQARACHRSGRVSHTAVTDKYNSPGRSEQQQQHLYDPLQTLLTAAKKVSSMAPPQPQSAAPLCNTSARTVPAASKTSPIPPNPFRKPSYKTSLVSLTPEDLLSVVMPFFYPRDTNRAHVEQLKTSIMQEGISDESGFIAFCAHFGQRHVVRGAHLLQAFTELYRQERVRYVAHEEGVTAGDYRKRLGFLGGIQRVGKITCALVQRVDDNSGTILETPFTATETLLLAAHYNSKHGHIRPMTMLDNITLAQRFIQCRLRDLHLSDHLESTTMRSTPPNAVWSKLPQFVSEATTCNLIPYSTTPSSASVHLDASETANDTTALKQHKRTVRQRQAEYLRLAMSLLWSPHTQGLIMTRHTFNGSPITSSLWSLRTFRLQPFTSADDTVQFVMLLALYRCQHERRGLDLRPFDREKTKQFLQLIETCLKKMVAWTMNGSKPPFPTKWDILNAETTFFPEQAADGALSAPPSSNRARNKNVHNTQRVKMATILMTLLTRWEHNGREGNRQKSTCNRLNGRGCTSDNILSSLRCFMQRWPFNRKWRALSQTLPCFQPELFLQPLLPLDTVRCWPLPTSPSAVDTVPIADQTNGDSQPANRPLSTEPCPLVSVNTSKQAAATTGVASQPRPQKLATILPAIGENNQPVPVPSQTTSLPAADFDPLLIKQLAMIKNNLSMSQQQQLLALTFSNAPFPAQEAAPVPPPSGTACGGTAGATDNGAIDEEETLDGGQGRLILDGSDREGGTDTEDDTLNRDHNSSTETEPVSDEGNDKNSGRNDMGGQKRQTRRRTEIPIGAGTVLSTATQSRKRRGRSEDATPKPLGTPLEERNFETRKTKKKRRTLDSEDVPNSGPDQEEGGDDDSSNSGSDGAELEPLYDKISAQLPAPTGVQDLLPTACHELGAWKHYITKGEMQQLREVMVRRCAALYFSEQHPTEGDDGDLAWPISVGRRAYCNNRRYELHTDGYTILRDVLNDSPLASDADAVIHHFAKFWQGEKICTVRQQKQNVWKHIFNCGVDKDPEYAMKGIGRYTVGVSDLVDRAIEKHPDIFRKRLRVETALGVLIDEVLQEDKKVQHPLRFPITGSRLLFHTRHALPQLPHYDFGYMQYENGTAPWRPGCQQLSYFAMLSGSQGFHIRVWRDGHRLMYGPFALVQKIATTLVSELVYIPPYSIIIVRGDLPHAGVGGEEPDGPLSPLSPEDRMHIRFHMYVARHFDQLKDGVYVAHHSLKINDISLTRSQRAE